jgi:hypothetical protein
MRIENGGTAPLTGGCRARSKISEEIAIGVGEDGDGGERRIRLGRTCDERQAMLRVR